MKVLQIAAKDLRRSLRSAFLIAMSVAVPLLITGLLYFAFGGLIDGEAKGAFAPIKVIVVNLDQPDRTTGFAGGRLMAQHLVSPEMSNHLSAKEGTDAAAARADVDAARAAVAVIIPEGFSRAVLGRDARAEVQLYEDPASTLGPMVVRAVLAASGFGVMLMSFLKSTRQAGPATGFVVTLTGVLGGLIPTGDPTGKSPFETVGSVFPQAWAFRGLKLAIAGGDVLAPALILAAFGVLLFVIGALTFRRRFR